MSSRQMNRDEKKVSALSFGGRIFCRDQGRQSGQKGGEKGKRSLIADVEVSKTIKFMKEV
jgi:hypothetical protein